MKVRSVKFNYLLSTLRIVSSTLLGFLTMPYINKVLGPESLGKVEYVNSIVTYFILFSALGIPMYGIRQIAKVRNNPLELSKNLLEILFILIITTALAYIGLFLLICSSNFLVGYEDLIILMSSMILLSNLGAEWFFQGIEDQLYITIRYLIVRAITILLLFTFVKSDADYLIYALVVVLNFCGSNLLNLIRLNKYIKWREMKNLDLRRHLKPSITVFLASVSVSIYLQIDNFLLGYMAGDRYVGYYSAANKLMRYVVLFITSIGSVMLPRLSNYWIEDKKAYYKYLQKTFGFIILISLPFSNYFYLFAEPIIKIMAGSEFLEAILTMQILSPICLIVGIAYFLGYLVLYPQNHERIYTVAVATSAGISIVLNYFLINKFQQNGAAIVQVLSEILGIVIMLYFIRKLNMFQSIRFKTAICSLIINIGLLIFLRYIFTNYNLIIGDNFMHLFLGSVLFFSTYFILLIIIREEVTVSLLNLALKRFRN
ncbi:flippase [Sphingobacterium spiritivorum]|uniref:flippase n=1 Tax=Sphingobacterium spiritivorum TaxID=258 RepID=UPI003DA1FCD8